MLMNLLAGLLGLIFVTLSKMQGMKKDFETANQTFVASKFLSDEIIGIGMSLTVIILMAITVQEWVKVSPKVADYITIIFALGGAIGSWAFLLLLGKSKKYIRSIVDIKSNIVDNDLGKTETITELKQAAKEQGKDITTPNP